jgi:hypothetical protein
MDDVPVLGSPTCRWTSAITSPRMSRATGEEALVGGVPPLLPLHMSTSLEPADTHGHGAAVPTGSGISAPGAPAH